MTSQTTSKDLLWPALPYEEWKDTYATLHMWTQIVGKIQLKQASFVNHWWEVAYFISMRGFRTAPIPFGHRVFEIEFDFVEHLLNITTHDGAYRAMALSPRSVAEFYKELMTLLKSIQIDIQIDREPKEVPNPIPFDQDFVHASYDKEYANRHWRILVQVDRVMRKFRTDFLGKCSPIHFFWGSFDLAMTRFSGRRAPARPEADHITQIAYSHEVISFGFWPGGGNILEPAFYAYAAPEPQGFQSSPMAPGEAFYNPGTRGFILKYDDVRKAKNPDQMILDFYQSVYRAGAELGDWDRSLLEAA